MTLKLEIIDSVGVHRLACVSIALSVLLFDLNNTKDHVFVSFCSKFSFSVQCRLFQLSFLVVIAKFLFRSCISL